MLYRKRNGHDPLLARLIPEHLGIAEFLVINFPRIERIVERRIFHRVDHRILFVRCPSEPVVRTESDELGLGALRDQRAILGISAVLPKGSGVNRNEWWVASGTEAATVLLVHNGAAGEDRYSVRCRYGDGQLFPVRHVFANGMSPRDGGTPRIRERVVLVEHVVLASIAEQSVWVVHPVLCRREMVLGAKRFLIGWLGLGKDRMRIDQRDSKCRDA